MLGTANPPYSSTIVPLAKLVIALHVIVDPFAMLTAKPPLTLVAPAVRPRELTVPIFLIFEVQARIQSTVLPCEDPLTMHSALLPVALIHTSIGPGVDSLVVQKIFSKLSSVEGAVRPKKFAETVFLSFEKVTFVPGLVSPNFNTVTMLVVVFPHPVIDRAHFVLVKAETVCHVIEPIALV